MTREEEIKLYLKERNIPFNSLEANSIIECVQWADKTMLDKACEWLQNWASLSVNDTTDSLDEEDLVKRFKKAMEE